MTDEDQPQVLTADEKKEKAAEALGELHRSGNLASDGISTRSFLAELQRRHGKS